MDIISFRGLNCYLRCVVNGAALLGIDYEPALASLWSETQFQYLARSNVYLTKQMITDFNNLGFKIHKFPCHSPEEKARNLASFSPGEWMIVGMDAFHIATTAFYQTFHRIHFFLASKRQDGSLIYVDPSCNRTDLTVTPEDIIAHAIEIQRLSIEKSRPLNVDITQEAQAAIQALTHQNMTFNVRTCVGEKQKNAERLAKYVDAMINNRYLYTCYLQKIGVTDRHPLFFQEEYYQRWVSVKHGLYKISLTRDNKALIEQVCSVVDQLIEDEIHMAKEILRQNNM